jgi:hypothetical protein
VVPEVALDSVEETIDNCVAGTAGAPAVPFMVNAADCVCEGNPLSVTVTTKFEDEVEVGIPEIIPEDDNESPAGS